jgi:hypothetical protein
MTATANAYSASVIDDTASTHGNGELPYQVSLELFIDDPEIIRALYEYAEGDERNQYAVEAMKIGILALRHVGGQVSVDQLRNEGDRFIGELQKELHAHKQTVQDQIEAKLKEYFDPKSGRFEDRVQRLVAQDGELSKLIKSFVDGENSLFAKTLVTHVGRDSALMKQLDPKQTDGLLAVLKQLVESELAKHRTHILDEFSLDNEKGALKRLTKELSQSNNEIVKELSLNEEGSALNRLVQRVNSAQVTITNEFSLDNDASCLSKLKKELMTVLEAHVESNAEFQQEVKLALSELTIRKAEQARSTVHGKTFERVVCEFIQSQITSSGDLAEFVGDNVGIIASCKKGDIVVKLGCDSNAPGAKIIIEAKEDKKYTLTKALDEIDEARRNRGAQVGVFVFSTKTAPQNLRPIARYGNDIIVVWNAEDPLTDSFLWAAIEFARLTCFRSQAIDESQASDFENIEKLIANIEKRAANLNQIRKYAETAQSSAKDIHSATAKIIKRAGLDKKSLDRQISRLRGSVEDLKKVTNTP